MIILKTNNTTVWQDETTQDISIVEKIDSNDRDVLNRLLELAESSRIQEIDDDLHARLIELVKERDEGKKLSLAMKNKYLQEELDRHKDELRAVGNDLDELETSFNIHMSMLHDSRDENERWKNENNALNEDLDEQEELNFRLKEENLDLQYTLDDLTKNSKEWALGYKELKEKINMQDDTILDQENVIEEQEDIIQDLRDVIADHEQREEPTKDIQRAVQGLIQTLFSKEVIDYEIASRLNAILWDRE